MPTLCSSCSSPPRLCCECRHVLDEHGNWLAPKWSSRSTIVAVILSGGNRENAIGDAILSVVGFVDAILFIHTGSHADKAVELGRKMCSERGVASHVAYYRRKYDCATARNFGLKEAGKLKYTWAMTLDTDERIELPNGYNIKLALDTCGKSVALIHHFEHWYSKERFFRLPATGKFEFKTHEAYRDGQTWALLVGPTFRELDKTQEEMDRSQRTIRDICRREIKRGTDAPDRYWMYLGTSLSWLGEKADAMRAFETAAQLSKMDEHKGWSYFRAACLAIELGEFDKAIELSLAGMRWAPDFPELEWVAGQAQFRAGRVTHAMAHSSKCLAIGCAQSRESPIHPRRERAFMRYVPASYEDAWELRRMCVDSLGMPEEVTKASAMIEKARILREGK